MNSAPSLYVLCTVYERNVLFTVPISRPFSGVLFGDPILDYIPSLSLPYKLHHHYQSISGARNNSPSPNPPHTHTHTFRRCQCVAQKLERLCRARINAASARCIEYESHGHLSARSRINEGRRGRERLQHSSPYLRPADAKKKEREEKGEGESFEGGVGEYANGNFERYDDIRISKVLFLLGPKIHSGAIRESGTRGKDREREKKIQFPLLLQIREDIPHPLILSRQSAPIPSPGENIGFLL